MSATVLRAASPQRLGAHVWGAVVAAWGVVTGIAPHVLHHVGPLAGAALLAGFGAKAIFFALGLVLSIPMLRRLHRRFRTIIAPVLAVVAFATVSPSLALSSPRGSPVPSRRRPRRSGSRPNLPGTRAITGEEGSEPQGTL